MHRYMGCKGLSDGPGINMTDSQMGVPSLGVNRLITTL